MRLFIVGVLLLAGCATPRAEGQLILPPEPGESGALEHERRRALALFSPADLYETQSATGDAQAFEEAWALLVTEYEGAVTHLGSETRVQPHPQAAFVGVALKSPLNRGRLDRALKQLLQHSSDATDARLATAAIIARLAGRLRMAEQFHRRYRPEDPAEQRIAQLLYADFCYVERRTSCFLTLHLSHDLSRAPEAPALLRFRARELARGLQNLEREPERILRGILAGEDAVAIQGLVRATAPEELERIIESVYDEPDATPELVARLRALQGVLPAKEASLEPAPSRVVAPAGL